VRAGGLWRRSKQWKRQRFCCGVGARLGPGPGVEGTRHCQNRFFAETSSGGGSLARELRTRTASSGGLIRGPTHGSACGEVISPALLGVVASPWCWRLGGPDQAPGPWGDGWEQPSRHRHPQAPPCPLLQWMALQAERAPRSTRAAHFYPPGLRPPMPPSLTKTPRRPGSGKIGNSFGPQ